MKKNHSEKVSPPFLKRLTPIPYVHTFTLLFIIYWIPPLGKANGIHPPPLLKKWMGGGLGGGRVGESEL